MQYNKLKRQYKKTTSFREQPNRRTIVSKSVWVPTYMDYFHFNNDTKLTHHVNL